MKTIQRPKKQREHRPVPTGDDRVGASKVVGVVLLAVFAVMILLVALVVLAGLFLRVGGGSSDQLEPRQLPPVAGAPEADIVMVVTPVGEAGVDIANEFGDFGGGVMQDYIVDAGSVTHAFDVRTSFDDYSVYEWTEIPKNAAPPAAATACFGVFSDRGSSAACFDGSGEAPATPQIGMGSTSDGEITSYEVTANQLGEDAAWAVVDTRSGLMVAAQVVDGNTYLQWPGTWPGYPGQAEPTGVRVLNADFEQIGDHPIG